MPLNLIGLSAGERRTISSPLSHTISPSLSHHPPSIVSLRKHLSAYIRLLSSAFSKPSLPSLKGLGAL